MIYINSSFFLRLGVLVLTAQRLAICLEPTHPFVSLWPLPRKIRSDFSPFSSSKGVLANFEAMLIPWTALLLTSFAKVVLATQCQSKKPVVITEEILLSVNDIKEADKIVDQPLYNISKGKLFAPLSRFFSQELW